MTSQGAPEAGAWVQYPDGSIWSSDGTRCAVSAYASATCGRAGDYYECAGATSEVKLRVIPEVLEALNRSAASPSPPPGVGATWRDESMAMHWIDRYASGIDHEPQMSRILACVATPPVGVEVVKLEWVQPHDFDPTSYAETILGTWTVWDFSGKDAHVRGPRDRAGRNVGGDIENAKSVAFAEYGSILRSALVPSSLLKEAEEALREEPYFVLEWVAGARPPVHPEPMRGHQAFASIEKAVAFMAKQAPDAQFERLTECTLEKIDRSDGILARLGAAP